MKLLIKNKKNKKRCLKLESILGCCENENLVTIKIRSQNSSLTKQTTSLCALSYLEHQASVFPISKFRVPLAPCCDIENWFYFLLAHKIIDSSFNFKPGFQFQFQFQTKQPLLIYFQNF